MSQQPKYVNPSGGYYKQNLGMYTSTIYDAPGLGYDTKKHNMDWWRCEACRCAVPLMVNNNLQLKCPDCGSPIPEKYDTR